MNQSILALLLVSALSGCATHEPNKDSFITGEASYRERIAMLPGIRFEAVLQDVSLADAPAVEIGKFVVEDAGNPPFSFNIAYNPSDIKPGHRYTVRASLKNGDTLLFTTDKFVPVISNGVVSDIKITMIRVATPQP